MNDKVTLMKGNEALAMAMIRYGADGYFGYPITPQSEVLEKLEEEMPWETTGMVVLQAESEVAAINMVYGGAMTGKAVCTSTSSPGFSLMQEGVSYLAASEVPALLINVQRGGPGLGTIHASQADYFQACKGGGHGDYHMIVLAPSSVQEMADMVALGFDLAFKYRCVSMILADGTIGQLMEKVVLPEQRPRRTDDEIREQCPWAVNGRKGMRPSNVVTSRRQDGGEQLALPGLLPRDREERDSLRAHRHRGLRLPDYRLRYYRTRRHEDDGTRPRRGYQGGYVPSHYSVALPREATARGR